MKKINSLFALAFLFFGIFFTQSSEAQRTGSFDTAINFHSNPSWTLSYYVPTTYNPANKYKLVICLHGLGDTPENMRNFFLQSILSSDTLGLVNNTRSPLYNNAIILCPYLEGVNTDLWEPVSDTALVTTCIKVAEAVYNIDPHYIYLSGFSLGARGALRYGLLNYWRFRGLDLWTPAIQNMNEANDLTSFYYPWKNGRYIPTYISVGGADSYFPPEVTTAYRHMADTGAIVSLQIVYGLPHDPPANANTFFGFNYVDSHATSYATNDAGISSISSPYQEICSTSFTPVVNIQNKGINNLTSATINYQIDNGTVNTYNWSGNLIQLGIDKVTLPLQTVSAGAHTFKAYTSMPNGVADTVPSNDTITETFNSITTGGTVLNEGFEGSTYPPANWRLAGTDSAWGWELVHSNYNGGFSLFDAFQAGAYGTSTSCIYFDNAVPNNTGKKYSIITPICDVSGTTSPALQYDYAYAPWDKYYSDTLAIYYSTDCGNTWDTLLVKGGTELSTVGGYDSSGIFFPDSTQWRHQAINLTNKGLAGEHEIMFSFENISGYGNLMYLDNINVATVTGVPNETQQNNFVNIYPNPNNGRFTLQITNNKQGIKTVEIYNTLGQQVCTSLSILNSQLSINLSNQPNGIYLYRVISESGELIGEGKIVVQR